MNFKQVFLYILLPVIITIIGSATYEFVARPYFKELEDKRKSKLNS